MIMQRQAYSVDEHVSHKSSCAEIALLFLSFLFDGPSAESAMSRSRACRCSLHGLLVLAFMYSNVDML